MVCECVHLADMDLRCQTCSWCHAHLGTKSDEKWANYTWQNQASKSDKEVAAAAQTDTQHKACSLSKFGSQCAVTVNVRDPTADDCWAWILPFLNLHATMAPSAGKKVHSVKPASACCHSGIKFTMLPQPIYLLLKKIQSHSNRKGPTAFHFHFYVGKIFFQQTETNVRSCNCSLCCLQWPLRMRACKCRIHKFST